MPRTARRSYAEPSSRLRHSPKFTHGGWHVVDIHQRTEGNDEIVNDVPHYESARFECHLEKATRWLREIWKEKRQN